MKFRLTLLLALFALSMALFVNTAQAANRKAFKPVHTKEQILDWLKKHNYEVKKLLTKPWLLYSVRLQDRHVYFRPVDGVDHVVVSSKVELVKTDQGTTSSEGMPSFRYYYGFENPSIIPFRSIFCYAFEISFNDISRSDIRKITNSELWTYSEQFSEDEMQMIWIPLLGVAISRNLPVLSYKEFMFQCQSVPGITTARVKRHQRENAASDINLKKNKMAISLSGEEIVPDLIGKVIGPEKIPAEWGALKLTQRLESLTSECIKLGWLDESAAKPLKQHLTDGKTALQNNQQTQAKQAIQAFADALKQMEKEIKTNNPSQEPLLTQEAATLLGTNTVYLLTKF